MTVVKAHDFTDAIPTTKQLEAGGHLCAYLMLELSVPHENIKGLKELVAHQSPGQQWLEGQVWKDQLTAQIDRELAKVPASPTHTDSQVAELQARIAELERELAAVQEDGRWEALQARIVELERQLEEAKTGTSPVTDVVPEPSIQVTLDELPKHATGSLPTRPGAFMRQTRSSGLSYWASGSRTIHFSTPPWVTILNTCIPFIKKIKKEAIFQMKT